MNYPYPTSTPYMQAAMSQAVQAIMTGAPLPPNCLVMAVPYQQVPPMMPQIRMTPAMSAKDQMALTHKSPYYGPSPYRNPPSTGRAPPQTYNYAVVPFMNKPKSKGKQRQPLHSNLYNSSSFDSYMRNLSWSRLFNHRPSQKTSKRPSHEDGTNNSDKRTSSTKKQQQQSNSSLSSSSSSSSSSSTTSDETIRRVTVTSRPPSNLNSKQQTKGSLPFKYSSEFLPGIGKQQVKQNDVFIINKA